MRRFARTLSYGALAAVLIHTAAISVQASRLNPVVWSVTGNEKPATPGSTVTFYLRAKIEAGYHLYSLTTPKGGPIKTSVKIPAQPALDSYDVYQPGPNRHTDPTLGVPVETFEGEVDLPILIHLSAKTADSVVPAEVQVRYQACSNEICLPPVTRTVKADLQLLPGKAVIVAAPNGYSRVDGAGKPVAAKTGSGLATILSARFLFSAFGFGMLTLLTPCVFSSLPLTLAFLARGASSTRRSTVKNAALFSLGIVVLFVAVGLGITAIAGPFGALRLATNPYVNLAIAVVFIAMGMSLAGAFELALPSKLLTGADRAASGNGVAATVLLGLTFCLTSFACIGPFLGTLLAASAQSGGWTPALGTVAFATGLALPIFLLAIFPAYLKKLPKSGPWMDKVKVVAGFVILGLAFKYAGAADSSAHWNLFTRERILAIWFALSLVMTFYLLGLVRLRSESATESLSLGRLLAGVAALALSASLLPGFVGGPIPGWDTLLPVQEPSTERSAATAGGPLWLKNDYIGALARAKAEGKPLLVAFGGYSCTNCHWMKANVLSKPEVKQALARYVLVELYTDGTDAESIRNQKLELERFGTIALPFYTIVNDREMQVATQDGLVRNPGAFVEFLRRA